MKATVRRMRRIVKKLWVPEIDAVTEKRHDGEIAGCTQNSGGSILMDILVTEFSIVIVFVVFSYLGF
jgi:hypothetical protein